VGLWHKALVNIFRARARSASGKNPPLPPTTPTVNFVIFMGHPPEHSQSLLRVSRSSPHSVQPSLPQERWHCTARCLHSSFRQPRPGTKSRPPMHAYANPFPPPRKSISAICPRISSSVIDTSVAMFLRLASHSSRCFLRDSGV